MTPSPESQAHHRAIIEANPPSEHCSCDPAYGVWCAFHAERDVEPVTNPRLKGIPTEMLTESLLALADLRRKYEGEGQVTRYAAKPGAWGQEACPLCIFQNTHKARIPFPCKRCFCPWQWIDGCDCSTRGQEAEGDALTRITRWEKAINAELAARIAL